MSIVKIGDAFNSDSARTPTTKLQRSDITYLTDAQAFELGIGEPTVQEPCYKVLKDKYLKGEETAREEIYDRVSRALGAVEENYATPFLHSDFDELVIDFDETTKSVTFTMTGRSITLSEFWGFNTVQKSQYVEFWRKAFYENQVAGGVGAGRIASACGTDINATLINCFVSIPGDYIQQGTVLEGVYKSISRVLEDAAETMRRGGGNGFSFNNIRPKNAFVKGTHSEASGP